MAFTISLPARSVCSVEIDAVQQRLVSKIERYVKIALLLRRAAPGTPLRRSAARPVEMLSLTRVAAISSSDRDAAVTRRSCDAHVPGGNEL